MSNQMNSRARLGSVAAAGALLGVPLTAQAQSHDAGLVGLCARAEALYADLCIAENHLGDLERSLPATEPPPQAKAEVIRLRAETRGLWRSIAFTPAKTVEGVFAKLAAVSRTLADGALDPDEFPDDCEPEDVAWMAAADLASLRKTTEA